MPPLRNENRLWRETLAREVFTLSPLLGGTGILGALLRGHARRARLVGLGLVVGGSHGVAQNAGRYFKRGRNDRHNFVRFVTARREHTRQNGQESPHQEHVFK